MNIKKFKIERDANFFKYKLMQIIVMLVVSLIIYFIYTVFDLQRFEKKNEMLDKPVNKEDLRPQNMFKKYFSPDEKEKE